jgi:hypothetical protein
MSSKPTLYVFHNANIDVYTQTQYTAFDTSANTRNLDFSFIDTIINSQNTIYSTSNYFTIIPGAITYSFPLYFSILVSETYNSLSNPSYKINANTFGANSKIKITGSTGASYAIWTNPSSTGDALFSTTSLATYFVTGSIYGFGGTQSSTSSNSAGGWTQNMRMQLSVDNTSNNADVVNPLNYTVTYSWTET